MTIEIQETLTNRFMRILIKSVFVFSLFFGIIFFISCVLIKKYLTGATVALLTILLYSWLKNNRVVKINLINDKSVVLTDGNKEVELRKQDISYVSKFVKFTVTKNFVLYIALKGDHFFTVRRYWFLNDSQNNLIELFKNMQIELKNIP